MTARSAEHVARSDRDCGRTAGQEHHPAHVSSITVFSCGNGSYRVECKETTALDDAALTLLRRNTLGFVFQFRHLLPAFTALENVTLPASDEVFALMRHAR